MVIMYSTIYLRHGLGLILRTVRVANGVVIYVGLLSRTGGGNVRVSARGLRGQLNIPAINVYTHAGRKFPRLLTTIRGVSTSGGTPVFPMGCDRDARGTVRVLYSTLEGGTGLPLGRECVTLHLLARPGGDARRFGGVFNSSGLGCYSVSGTLGETCRIYNKGRGIRSSVPRDVIGATRGTISNIMGAGRGGGRSFSHGLSGLFADGLAKVPVVLLLLLLVF